MKTRKRALTAQIKPDTRNAIMDQLAAAADEIIELRTLVDEDGAALARAVAMFAKPAPWDGFGAQLPKRPWWRRLLQWGRA